MRAIASAALDAAEGEGVGAVGETCNAAAVKSHTPADTVPTRVYAVYVNAVGLNTSAAKANLPVSSSHITGANTGTLVTVTPLTVWVIAQLAGVWPNPFASFPSDGRTLTTSPTFVS